MAGDNEPLGKNFTPPDDTPDTLTAGTREDATEVGDENFDAPSAFATSTVDPLAAFKPAGYTVAQGVAPTPPPPGSVPSAATPVQANPPTHESDDVPTISTKPGPSGLSPFEEAMVDHWAGKGMSPAGISGILGATHLESGGEGGYKAIGDGGTSYGAYQHHNERVGSLIAYADRNGLNPWTPQAQNGLAYEEIKPGGPEYEGVKSVWQETNPARSADTWVRNFERPADPGTESAAAQAYAQRIHPIVQKYLTGKAAAQGTQLASAAPQQTSDSRMLAVGDSIAAGVAGVGGYKQTYDGNTSPQSMADTSILAASGRSTQQTLSTIRANAGALKNQNVVLSSGMSNDMAGGQGNLPKALTNVRDQLQACRTAGANVALLGVGAGVANHEQINGYLKQLADANGATFTGPLAGTERGSVHPDDYHKVIGQLGSFGQPTPQAASPQAAPQPPPEDTTAEDAAAARFQKIMSTPLGQGKFDDTPVKSNVPLPVTNEDQAAEKFQRALAAAPAQTPGKPPVPGSTWGELGQVFGDWLRGGGSGLASRLGLPADIANFVNHYYAEHPKDAAILAVQGADGMPIDWTGNNPATQYIEGQQEVVPGQKGLPRIPLGTEDVKAAFKYATGLDLDQHGRGVANDMLYDMGTFMGAGASPAQAMKPGATLAGTLIHQALFPALASGGMDLGRWATDKSVDNGWITPERAEQLGIAGRLGLGLAGMGAMSRAGSTKNAIADALSPESVMRGVFEKAYGGEAEGAAARARAVNELDRGTSGDVEKTVGDHLSDVMNERYAALTPEQNTRMAQITQEIGGIPNQGRSPEQAQRVQDLMAERESMIGSYADQRSEAEKRYNLTAPYQIAPGYQGPAAFKTSDMALQQMGHDVMQRNLEVLGADGRNIQHMEAMRPQGDAQDAEDAIQKMQEARQQNYDERIWQAQLAAEQARDIAARGTSGQPLQWGGAGAVNKFNLGQETVDQLRLARDDAFATADKDWDVARAQGFTTAQAPITRMMGQIEGVMGDSIRMRQGSDMPWDIVNDLYEKNPQSTLFDKLGNRNVGADAKPIFKEGDTTIDQIHGLDSRLGNAIRMEQDKISAPGSGGDPSRLRRLVQIRQIVHSAVMDGAQDAGGNTAMALQNAINSTASAYNNFVIGGLGHVLNEKGGAANAPEALRSFLGNSQKAILARDALHNAIMQRTGASELAAGGTPPPPEVLQQHIWNTMADWMRQDYLQIADGHSPTAAKTWLTNHQGMFDRLQGNPVFDNLQAELKAHQGASDPTYLKNVTTSMNADKEALDKNAAGIFLNGQGPTRLDTILKAPAAQQAGMMNDLINDTAADPTGRAFDGLQRLMWDRIEMASRVNGNPANPAAYHYSWAKGKDFMAQAQPAIDALRAKDPETWARMDRFVNTMQQEDRRYNNPMMALPQGGQPGAKGGALGQELASRLFQMGFSRLIGPLFEGGGMAHGMQAMQQTSAYGRSLFNFFNDKLPWVRDRINANDLVGKTQKVIADALMDRNDPTKLRALLAPVQGPLGQKWAKGVEPWLAASGITMLQPTLNPPGEGQEQPEAAPTGVASPGPGAP